MHSGAYTDHGTCSTPLLHCTPPRVTPAVPAAAGAVNVTLPPELLRPVTLLPAAPDGTLATGVLESPASVVSVAPLCCEPCTWPPELALSRAVFCLALLVGTSVTIRMNTTAPTASGVYRRRTRAR